MNNRLSEVYFYTKFTLLNPYYRRYYNWLKRNERLSEAEISECNWFRRRKLLQHAYDNVKFYRRKFKSAGIHPSDIRQPDDFVKVPILTKEEIRQHRADMISAKARKRFLEPHVSGGSTGVPLKVYHDRRIPTHAVGWSLLERWDIKPWDNAAFIVRIRPGLSTPIDSGQRVWSIRNRLFYSIALYPTRHAFLNALEITEQHVQQFLNDIKRIKPRLIAGYVGAMLYLANYMESHSIRIPSIKAVCLTGSPYLDTQRAFIEHVFEAPAYNQYGSNEIYWIAAECKQHEGLHISSDIRHVEIVDDAKNSCSDGELGNIVLTDLDNYAFPLIRYINDDKGQKLKQSCSCGLPFPLMDNVKGRRTDLIALPDNTVISGQCFGSIAFLHADAVQQYQIVQEADYSITLSIIPNRSDTNLTKSLSEIRRSLREITKGQVPTEVKVVDEIPHERGKLRFIISKIETLKSIT